MFCLFVYFISFSTSERSNHMMSLFYQLVGCLSQGTNGTNSTSQLVNLVDSWPFVSNFSSSPVKNFEFWKLDQCTGRKVSHFPAWYYGRVQKRHSFDLTEPNTRQFSWVILKQTDFCPLKRKKLLRMKAVWVSASYILKHLLIKQI